MEACLYEPLDAEALEIRVLEILQGSPETPVECRMVTVSLQDHPEFVALSYVWGNPLDVQNITINGHVRPVTRKLESALRHARWHIERLSPNTCKVYPLWADAICINQADFAERTFQVQLMRNIYSKAKLVLSWIGPDDHSLAFSTIKTIANEVRTYNEDDAASALTKFYSLDWMRVHPRMCKDGEATNDAAIKNAAWAAVSSLLDAAYWSRVWIFQEVVLARVLLLFCPGTASLDWDTLSLVADRLSKLKIHFNTIAKLKPDFVSRNVWAVLTTPLLSWGAIDRLSGSRRAKRKMMRAPESQEVETFSWIMVSLVIHLRATNPKDYIYGILGLTDLPIVPDYSPQKTIADVYVEYVMAYLDVGRRGRLVQDDYPLSFLGYAGVGLYGYTVDFPSWVPNYPAQGQRGRSTTRVVNCKEALAWRGMHVAESAFPSVSVSQRSLHVLGVQLGPIQTVVEAPSSKTWYDGRMRGFIRDFTTRHPQYVSRIPAWQAIYRLVNRDPSCEVDEHTVRRALALLRFIASPYLNAELLLLMGRLKLLGFSLSSTEPSFEHQFLQAFFPGFEPGQTEDLAKCIAQGVDGPLAGVWDSIRTNLVKIHLSWRFFETTDGYLGLAPVGTLAGDLLCILHHCNVPVILRKVPDADYYIFVGTTFVVGLMDGEAFQRTGSKQDTPRWFELH